MNDQSLVGRMIQVCVRPEDVKKVRGLILSLAISGNLTSKEDNSEDISGTFVIPSDWKWCTLSEIAACRGSKKAGSDGIKPSDWILDMEDIDGATGTVHTRATFKERSSLSTKSAFKPGDVLYGKLRPYLNKVVLADSPGFCTTEIIPITPGSAVESRYLQLALRSPYFLTYVAKRSYGMKMPRLGTKDLESSRIPLPPLDEQKRIVAKVDELMALCDRLEVQLKERDVKQAALAKAALAKFTEDPTPENLQLLFHPSFSIEPDGLKNCIRSLAIQGELTSSKTGEKRLGWQSSNLGALAAFLNGDRSKNYPSKNTRVASGVPFINAGHLSHGDVATDEMDYITEEHFNRLGGGKVQKGDVLYCLRGSLGKCAVVSSIDRGAIASSLVILRPGRLLDPHFLYLYLCSPEGNKLISKFDNGSAQPNLSAANVKKYTIHLPPIDEQQRIIRRTDELISLVNQLEDQLEASRTTGEKLLEAMVAELTAA